ncbi:hypothetical protein OAL04_04145 [Nitrospinae bacterium]|nr:hypothetical protein [Nitrospinota bacterium]
MIALLNKQASWRADKLEVEYYKQTNPTFKSGPSNVRNLMIRFLKFGLAKEKKGKTGYRLSLNKSVWSQDEALFEAISRITLFFHENPKNKLRNNTCLKTFLKRVKDKLAVTRFASLSRTNIHPITSFIISDKRDFEGDESHKLYPYVERSPDEIAKSFSASNKNIQGKQANLFTPTKKQENKDTNKGTIKKISLANSFINPVAGLRGDTPNGLPEGAARILNPKDFWPKVQEVIRKDNLNPSIYADQNALILELHISATRKQRIIIGIIQNLQKFDFLIFSLCGVIDQSINIAGVFKRAGLSSNGAHPQVLIIDGTPFVGVLAYQPLSLDVPFYEIVHTTGTLADKLEAEFWNDDIY